MKILPISRYDYDIFPLTEEFIEINEDGSETSSQVEKIGVINVAEEDLDEIRLTKKFTEKLDGIEDMTLNEIAEHAGVREADAAGAEVPVLKEQLASLDHYTNLRVEGALSEEKWWSVVRQRETLRARIAEIRTRYEQLAT